MPERIQLRRTKGWCKPEGAVVVARPTKWGNPLTLRFLQEDGHAIDVEEARQVAADWYRSWLTAPRCEVTNVFLDRRALILTGIAELRGRDLACWCPLDQPCHADVLLDLANGATT